MSFSFQVKKEIAAHPKTGRHCDLAELAALLQGIGEVRQGQIRFYTENREVALRVGELIERLFRFRPEVRFRRNPVRNGSYFLYVKKEAPLLLRACRHSEKPEELTKNACCKRAFLRGSFLASGSISDPAKTYHLEFITKNEEQADRFLAVMREFEIEAKIIRRKHVPVVYLKEGDQIVRLLNVMSAHLALMELENLRILKEMRNSVNRRVNCETANLRKTGQAAFRQLQAIEYIESEVGLEELSEELREVAVLRKEQMAASLKDLGQMLCPPIGRSGVNHRLRRIIEIADKIKEEREEN